MELLVKKFSNIVEIFEISCSKRVQNMTPQSLQKSYDWTIYFSKVNEKLKTKPEAKEQLIRKIKDKYCDCLRVHPICLKIEEDLLITLWSHLSKSLQNNRDFPEMLISNLEALNSQHGETRIRKGKYQESKAARHKNDTDANHCSRTIVSPGTSNADKQKYDEFAVNTEMTLPHKARILREKIASTVENIQKEELLCKRVYEVLDTAVTNPMIAVDAILLSIASSSGHKVLISTPEREVYSGCVIRWILSQPEVKEDMARRDMKMMQELSSQYYPICRIYLQSLVHHCNYPEKSTLSRDELRQRFQSLLVVGSMCKEATTLLLKRLATGNRSSSVLKGYWLNIYRDLVLKKGNT